MSESSDEIPYSNHPYAYAHSNPILYSNPSGKCLGYLWVIQTVSLPEPTIPHTIMQALDR